LFRIKATDLKALDKRAFLKSFLSIEEEEELFVRLLLPLFCKYKGICRSLSNFNFLEAKEPQSSPSEMLKFKNLI
jgi:hypothetical protein